MSEYLCLNNFSFNSIWGDAFGTIVPISETYDNMKVTELGQLYTRSCIKIKHAKSFIKPVENTKQCHIITCYQVTDI